MQPNTIEFLLDAHLQQVSFNPKRSEGIDFLIGGEHKLRLRMIHSDEHTRAWFQGLNCRVYAVVPVEQELREFVVQLHQNRFAAYSGMPITLPLVKRGKVRIESDGTIVKGYGVNFEYYPPAL